MQIVIDIDENVFTRLFDNGIEDYSIVNDDLFAIAKTIRKGTPLPKGHGRLIDADAFAIRGEYLEKLYGSDFYWEFKKQLDKHPTIIEADE